MTKQYRQYYTIKRCNDELNICIKNQKLTADCIEIIHAVERNDYTLLWKKLKFLRGKNIKKDKDEIFVKDENVLV